MEIALVDGQRSASRPGLIGECQVCGRPMISKCGQQLAWHWAHRARASCDPWWENEGPWHREWKSHFPREQHEVVAYDSHGEKHIADLKLADGLVVELQHSDLGIEEMRSREHFYGNMIWIVDASPFKRNITLFDPLPNPKLPFVDDLIIWPPHPSWRTNNVKRGMNYDTLLFARRSKQKTNDTMLLIEGGDQITEDFSSTYEGHHLFLWMKPRNAWYQASRPVYLDFGDNQIGHLMRYRPHVDELWCIKLLSKSAFLQNLVARRFTAEIKLP